MYNKIKKTCSIIVKYFRPLWVKFWKKRIIILNDRLFYFLSTAIVILIVIVIAIKHYDQKNEIYWQNVFNLNHLPIAMNSLITKSVCVYFDLLPHIKMNVNRNICWEPVLHNSIIFKNTMFIYKSKRLKCFFLNDLLTTSSKVKKFKYLI